MTQAAIDHYLAEHKRLSNNSAGWIEKQRLSALESLGRQGFPSTRHEAWKYTDVRSLLKQNFISVDTDDSTVGAEQMQTIRFPDLDCYELVFVNGHFNSALSSLPASGEAINVSSISTAGDDVRAKIEQYLNQYASTDKHGFAALNTAFLNDGTFIHAADNAQIDKPLHLVFISNKQNSSFIAHPRNLIILGSNARATVIESYIGLDNAEYCTNTVTEIITSEGAHLEHYKLQQESDLAYHIGYLHAHCHKDSRLDSHSISLGGLLVRNDIDTVLAGRGAHVGLNGLYIAGNNQHIDNHTRVDHNMPNTSSDETYRGVLDGKARAVFNGKVVVHKDAQQIDAQQSNANLLMSDDAEIDTKPELEIYADDVKCTHGATIGQLDENMLFYLRSRAIDETTARSLLTFAFADEVIKRISFAPIRERLEHRVVGRLPDASLISEFLQ
ncbi:MAG: Fe-S cluster assembly protein SufD [Gammaproteobacteria bacterium]|nr:Fe-S cluster assembly protein SufD [Gammaproteobacteria bacterium]